MKIISILSVPSKSIYIELDNLFSDSYGILYLNKLIRENMSSNDDVWVSIMEDIHSGNYIKNQDISNIIYNHVSKREKDCILLTAFPRTLEQINYFKGFVKNKGLDIELIGVFNTSNDKPSLKELFKDYDRVIEISKISDLVDRI